MPIWTPNGEVGLTRQDVAVPPEYLRMLLVLGDTANDMRLGLHCASCKQDVRGANASSDGVLKMECGCRTFIGSNPVRR